MSIRTTLVAKMPIVSKSSKKDKKKKKKDTQCIMRVVFDERIDNEKGYWAKGVYVLTYPFLKSGLPGAVKKFSPRTITDHYYGATHFLYAFAEWKERYPDLWIRDY